MKNKRQPSVINKMWNQVPSAEIQRSKFDRSHGYKTTFDEGLLVPVFVDEVLPGDTLNLRMSVFARLATPQTPFMDNMFLDSHFFFVPNRLTWNNWQKFMGEQEDPGDSTDYLIPQIVAPSPGGYPENTLPDYFGIPIGVGDIAVNALPFRAYNLIWNEWYRDQNLQDSAIISKGDGPDTTTQGFLRRRGKRHDYFTSALPWPQKGPSSLIPTGAGSSLVTRTPNAGVWTMVNSLTNAQAAAGNVSGVVAGSQTNLKSGAGTDISLDPNGGLNVTLTSTALGTINQLRQAFQIQKLYERDARGGTRYTEIIRSHFGVVSPDARLQRPEYLGGGTSPINVHPVAQTSETTTETPQGNLAAIGTVSASGHGFTKSFVEHGFVIGLVSVRADLNYQQGLERFWSRRTKLDIFWPALAHLGEQAILMREIYATGTNADGNVWGYIPRYDEYRQKPSIITGLFRSNAAGTLDYWHLAQDFATAPALNDSFIQENAPVDRVIAVPSEPHFLFDAYFNYKCARPMPTFAVPGLVDHF